MFSFSGCEFVVGPGTADYSYNLSGKYSLHHAGSSYICKENNGLVQKIIEPNISGIAWSDSYIIAKQEKDNEVSYYIIDANQDKILGPFSEEDFNKKRDELKIDEGLKLKDPEKYKK